MYCSRFVSRVLLAAQQSGGDIGAHVVSGALAERIMPSDLMQQPMRDRYWRAVAA